MNPDPSATEWVVPIGTDAAGDETTYLFNEVATLVTDGPSGTITTHTTETGMTFSSPFPSEEMNPTCTCSGTLVASASGFTLSIISTDIQGLKGAEGECHYTAADSGVCVQNLHGEGDLLTLTFQGPAATHTLPILTTSAAIIATP
ncbi:hypothetical protein GYMLUDRAFT_709427 [Collybiopsis luxurians FD-317 M1]|nr:hypothetical protein GYMLUDRAFT_709427 [Collybiopsis luxurians FD-317 M1]